MVTMSMMIVPIPLFDSEMAVESYWLEAHDGKKFLGVKDNFQRMDDAFFHYGLEMVERIGIESFTGGKRLFVPLSQMQLLSGLIERASLDRELVVCVLPADCILDANAARQIQILHKLGYQICLDGVPPKAGSLVMRYVSYLSLDHQDPLFNNLYAQARKEREEIQFIIRNIPDAAGFRVLKNNPRAYFTGGFYSRPITSKTKDKLSPVKVNALHLLNDINQEDFDLEDVIKIIERDPYLSVSLLRYLNSSASGLPRKVESIRQAVTILGQSSVRLWATVSLSAILGEDRPNEITKLALIRAKFAEGIAGAFELGVFQPSLFMAGLFSLLDVMLEKTMEDAVKEVAVNDLVRAAILGEQSPLTPVMEFIYAYEKAEWDQVSILTIQHETDMERVSKAYLDALLWYRSLLQSIDDRDEEN